MAAMATSASTTTAPVTATMDCVRVSRVPRGAVRVAIPPTATQVTNANTGNS